jgi:serine phosphatase RsbU (regulator of sigma subunit)/CHASE2 domain-containing sensor protein
MASNSNSDASWWRSLSGAALVWRGRPLALALVALALGVRAWDPGPVESLRLAGFDTLQAIEANSPDKVLVLVVGIDDRSLARYGQWPWPRTLIADLVARIAADQPRVIGFDILFPESDRLSPDRIAEQQPGLDTGTLALLRALPSNDARLGDTLATTRTVLAVAGVGAGGAAGRAASTMIVQRGPDPSSHLHAYSGLLSSVDPLTDAASGFGLISVPSERDGIVRRMPLVAQVAGTLRPGLAVELIRVAAGDKAVLVESDGTGVAGVGVAKILTRTDGDGRVWLRHKLSEPGRFVSAADILDGHVAPGAFANRIVIVVANAIALGDYFPTPLTPRMSGAEIHAQLVESIIAGDLLERPVAMVPIETLAALAAAALLMAFVPLVRPESGIAIAVALLGVLAGGAWVAFREFGVLFDATTPMGATIVSYTAVLGGTLAAAEAARRALRLALEQERLVAQRLEGELAAAREIQMGILPTTFPAFPGRRDVDVHALIEPARAVGGDFYDFALVDDHRLFFMIGDVSGKGVPASLFMALSKVLAKSAALREPADVGAALTRANTEIARENAAAMFVTLYAGVLDLRSGALQSVNAGHDAPFLLAPGQEPRRLDNDGGPPLCVVEDFPYPTEHGRLEPGDAIVLVTDGVTEAQNAAGDLFGLPAVVRTLETLPAGAPAADIATALRDAVNDHAAGAEPADDVTILVVRWTAAATA